MAADPNDLFKLTTSQAPVAQAAKAPTTLNPEMASQSASQPAGAPITQPANLQTTPAATDPKAATPISSSALFPENSVRTGGTSTAGPFQQADKTFTPIKSTVDKPTETVQGQLKSILDEGNPLMVAARNRGTATAAGRGLQNSSLAAGASQLAMINSALPVAQQDAATYSQRAMQNAANAQEFAVAQMAYYQELGKLKEQGNINAYLTTLQAGFDKELEHIRGGYALAVENVRGANELVAIAAKGNVESKLMAEKYGFDLKLSGEENLHKLEQLAAQGDINSKLQLEQFNYDSLLKDKDKDVALTLEDKRFQSQQNLVLLEYEQKGVLTAQEAEEAMARLNQQHVNTLAEIDKTTSAQAATALRNNYLAQVAARQASASAEITQIYTTPKLSASQQNAGVANAYARMDADIVALGKYYSQAPEWEGSPPNPNSAPGAPASGAPASGTGGAPYTLTVKGTNDTSFLTGLPVLPSGLDPGLDHKIMGEDADPLNLFSTDKVRLGGSIDGRSGTVTVPGKEGLSAQLTAYLLGTGPRPKRPDQKLKRLLSSIDAIKASGWKPSG